MLKVSLKAGSVLMAIVLGASLPSYAADLASLFGSKGNVNSADSGFSAKSQSKFLPVNEAFNITAKQEGERLVVNFKVTPEHYVYRDKIKLSLPSGVSMSDWQFSESAVAVDDPDFGRVPVFTKNFTATTTLSATDAINETVKVGWQGCAVAGLCYPPQKTSVTIALNATNSKANQSTKADNAKTQKSDAVNTQASKTDDNKQKNDKSNKPAVNTDTDQTKTNQDKQTLSNTAQSDKTSEATIPIPQIATSQMTADSDKLDLTSQPQTNQQANYPLSHSVKGVINDPFGFGKNPLFAILLLFVAGVVVSFSACVYPMIPIVANIVAKSHNPTPVRGFLLTLSYALGVATSYGILGALVAWFGRSLGIIGYLQNPAILIGFAVLFVLLSLNMLGVFHIRMPQFISHRLARTSQSADHKLGSLGGSYLVGALSSLVVSPCVSAPLGGALFTISVIGNVPLGFMALFALGMGISLPLLILGATQGHFMPKSGAWMEHIKHFGGLMLIAVAIMLFNRVFLGSQMLVVWAVWFMLLGVFLYNLVRLPLRAVGLVCGVWSVLLLAGFAMNHDDPIRPLAKPVVTTAKPAITVTTLDSLDTILQNHDKVLVDVTAQWCVECRIMDRTLFKNPPQDLQNWQVVKLDITETSDDSRQILSRYELFGPPSLLFYKKGQLIDKQIGEVKRDDFESILKNLK